MRIIKGTLWALKKAIWMQIVINWEQGAAKASGNIFPCRGFGKWFHVAFLVVGFLLRYFVFFYCHLGILPYCWKCFLEKKKGCMFILRTVTESNFFLVCLSIRWQWFSHYGEICFWHGNISSPKPCAPPCSVNIFITGAAHQHHCLTMRAFYLLHSIPWLPSPGFPRSYASILVTPCPWRPDTLSFILTDFWLVPLSECFGVSLTDQETFAELQALIPHHVAWGKAHGLRVRYTWVWSSLHR